MAKGLANVPISPEFWDTLAPHLAALEDHYFDRRSVRQLLKSLQPPVLVVGAGQGLLVQELHRHGLKCDGLDLSPAMVRYARLRRGLTLIEADAKAMPFPAGAYATIIYATGVIDFMTDEEALGATLTEGRRVVKPSGSLFVGFYRLSRAQENFLLRVGLLSNNCLLHKRCFEMYLLNPIQMTRWVAQQAGTSRFGAAMLLLRLSAGCTLREKLVTFRMQKVFRNPAHAQALLEAAAETQPYRTEAEIKNLFQRLAIPLRHLHASATCYIAQL